MTHKDHVNLIQRGVPKGGVWADFGSGNGAFTLALREAAGPDAEIYSIDKDEKALNTQIESFDQEFPGSKVHFYAADFTKPLKLPLLDGIIAANSIHFLKDRISVLETLKTYLKPGGRLIVVEYNVDTGNIWVPFPFSFQTFEELCIQAGLAKPAILYKEPSRFLNEMYSALTFKK